jgi:hypothetical protein
VSGADRKSDFLTAAVADHRTEVTQPISASREEIHEDNSRLS